MPRAHFNRISKKHVLHAASKTENGEADRLFLLVSASFYKPYLPATSFNAGVVPPLADSLRAAM
jgi:hypothetical protein